MLSVQKEELAMSLIQLISNLFKLKKAFLFVYLINSLIFILYVYFITGLPDILFPLSSSVLILLVYLIFSGLKLYSLISKI